MAAGSSGKVGDRVAKSWLYFKIATETHTSQSHSILTPTTLKKIAWNHARVRHGPEGCAVISLNKIITERHMLGHVSRVWEAGDVCVAILTKVNTSTTGSSRPSPHYMAYSSLKQCYMYQHDVM